MKITRIAIKSFLGLDHLDIALDKPVLLVSGPNAAGKTSIAHGLRFVLTDDLCRVEHKKDIKSLIREGAKLGHVSVWLQNSDSGTGTTWEYTRSAATGHFTSKHPPATPHPALSYCLDPSSFAEMEPNARLSFLYYLMGVNRSAASITKVLEERGHALVHIKRIETHLSGGFTAAHTETMGLAREVKGRWRQMTGETYGEVKAEGWSSEVPAVNPDDISRLTAAIQKYNEELRQLQTRLGAQKERAKLAQYLTETKRIAGDLDARTAAARECQQKVDQLTAEERQIREALEKAQASLTIEAHAVQGTFFECPACNTPLVYSRGQCKVCYEPPVDVRSETAAAEADVKKLKLRLTEVEDRKRICNGRLVDALNAVGHSEAAANALAELKEAHESSGDTEGAAEIEGQIAATVAERYQAQIALDQIEAARTAHENALSTTQMAALLHEEIKALTALAADLAPDGLPGELLSRAMRPINERLRESSIMAGWSSVSITTNGILVHSRPWALASGSERWRANAMIAEAIAHLSGIKCFVLDSLDILEPAQRAQALGWLMEVAPAHETVIVMATLKAQPKELPAAIQSEWLGEPKPDINLQGSTRGHDD